MKYFTTLLEHQILIWCLRKGAPILDAKRVFNSNVYFWNTTDIKTSQNSFIKQIHGFTRTCGSIVNLLNKEYSPSLHTSR